MHLHWLGRAIPQQGRVIPQQEPGCAVASSAVLLTSRWGFPGRPAARGCHPHQPAHPACAAGGWTRSSPGPGRTPRGAQSSSAARAAHRQAAVVLAWMQQEAAAEPGDQAIVSHKCRSPRTLFVQRAVTRWPYSLLPFPPCGCGHQPAACSRCSALPRTLKASVNWRCASLNSGVEKDRRGSSFLRISSSCGRGAGSQSGLPSRGLELTQRALRAPLLLQTPMI